MKEKKTFTIVALIIGIIAFILSGSPLGFILGIVAIVFAILGLNKENAKKRATIALILGILAVFIRFAVALKEDKPAAPDYQETTEETSVEVAEKPIKEPIEDDSVWAGKFTPISDFRYTVDKDNKTITLIRYEGDDTKIMLSPAYYLDDDYYKLVSMGDEACFLSETYITSVYIPDTVTFIGGSCFNSCSSLTDIRIPASATDIGDTFLSYLHDYNVVYEDIETPAKYDKTIYELSADDNTNAEELGEGFARAINGMLGGVNDESHSDKVITIHYSGTEEQWRALFPDEETSDISDDADMTDKGKDAGDNLAEDLANIDW